MTTRTAQAQHHARKARRKAGFRQPRSGTSCPPRCGADRTRVVQRARAHTCRRANAPVDGALHSVAPHDGPHALGCAHEDEVARRQLHQPREVRNLQPQARVSKRLAPPRTQLAARTVSGTDQMWWLRLLRCFTAPFTASLRARGEHGCLAAARARRQTHLATHQMSPLAGVSTRAACEMSVSTRSGAAPSARLARRTGTRAETGAELSNPCSPTVSAMLHSAWQPARTLDKSHGRRVRLASSCGRGHASAMGCRVAGQLRLARACQPGCAPACRAA